MSVNKGKITVSGFCEKLNEFARENDRDVSFYPKDFTDLSSTGFTYQLDRDFNVFFVLGHDVPYWYTESQVNEYDYERLVDKEAFLYCINDYLKTLYSDKEILNSIRAPFVYDNVEE